MAYKKNGKASQAKGRAKEDDKYQPMDFDGSTDNSDSSSKMPITLDVAKQNDKRSRWALTPSYGFFQYLGEHDMTLPHYAWETLLFIMGATYSGTRTMRGISSATIAAHIGCKNPTRVDEAIKRLASYGIITTTSPKEDKMNEARAITLNAELVYSAGVGDSGNLLAPKECYDRINKQYREMPKPDSSKKPKALRKWEEKKKAEEASKKQEAENLKQEGLSEIFGDLKMYHKDEEKKETAEDLLSLSPEERAAKLDKEGLEF